jgi:2-polyprenyl-6-methoxyphenol hydroxylase-like FAD-dependent oxidoreductase
MAKTIRTDVVVVGGGPAGAMMGLLLAKQGVEVVVVERSSTYSREFRGESISPGSVAILDQYGILDELKKHGYLSIEQMFMFDDGRPIFGLDFREFEFEHKFQIDLPQPVVIEAIMKKAAEHPNFQLRMGTKCVGLVEENDQIVGVTCQTDSEKFEIRSSLVVGADGRYTRVRKMAGLDAKIEHFSRDFVWFRLPRPDHWGNVNHIKAIGEKHMVILPTFPDMLRVGLYIPKGSYGELKKKDIRYFHSEVIRLEPAFDGLIQKHIRTWNDTVMLDIFSAKVSKWSRDGLVLIGDAAHTVSPVLGQGVNLAIQDVVDLAPVIASELSENKGEVIKREVLIPYEKQRKKEVEFVQNFQARQERILAAKTPLQVGMRRATMRVMNVAPWKKSVMKKIFYGRAGASRV